MYMVPSKAGHRKVVENYKTATNFSRMEQVFSSRSASAGHEIEFWMWGDSNAVGTFTVGDGAFGLDAILWFWMNFSSQEIRNVINGGANTEHVAWNLRPFEWHHFRVKITGSLTYELWWNGQWLGQYAGYITQSNFDRIRFSTWMGNPPYYYYVDAVDYSWTPGYYTNRNMNFIIPTIDYAIFLNNAQKTVWQPWNNLAQIDYNVSGTSLGAGIHNLSLFFNDSNGQWFHDDVVITVTNNIVAEWDIEQNINVEINLAKKRESDIFFNFQNTGNATLIALNFTINLPEAWVSEPAAHSFPILTTGANLTITFHITVPKSEKEFIEEVIIDFEAIALETGAECSDQILIVVTGAKIRNFMVWLIIIVGSATAAAVTTGYIVIRRRDTWVLQKIFQESIWVFHSN
jgi:hypothetical protein